MDNANRQHLDWWLFLFTLTLFLFGVVMNFSASSVMAADSAQFGHNPFYFLIRQVFWGLIGFVVMYLCWRADLDHLRRYSLAAILVAIALLGLVFTPLGIRDEGVRRALGFGPITFLPAEFAKLALVFYLADVFTRRKQEVQKLSKVIPTLIIFGLIFLLIMKQPNLSTGIMVASCYFTLLFMAGGRLSHLFALVGMGTVAVIFSMTRHTYQLERLLIFLNPYKDSLGAGYQIIQSRIALGAGGIFGLGLGNSRQKFLYLPENHTDFIMSIVGEELGLLGSVLVLLMFLALLYRGLCIARRSSEPFHAMLAAGLSFLICFQACINLGVVMGVLPPTGVSMPFISYGGSSLIAFMAAAGLLMNISRVNQNQLVSLFPTRRSRRPSRVSSTSPAGTPGPARRLRQGAGTLVPFPLNSGPAPAEKNRLSRAAQREESDFG